MSIVPSTKPRWQQLFLGRDLVPEQDGQSISLALPFVTQLPLHSSLRKKCSHQPQQEGLIGHATAPSPSFTATQRGVLIKPYILIHMHCSVLAQLAQRRRGLAAARLLRNTCYTNAVRQPARPEHSFWRAQASLDYLTSFFHCSVCRLGAHRVIRTAAFVPVSAAELTVQVAVCIRRTLPVISQSSQIAFIKLSGHRPLQSPAPIANLWAQLQTEHAHCRPGRQARRCVCEKKPSTECSSLFLVSS